MPACGFTLPVDIILCWRSLGMKVVDGQKEDVFCRRSARVYSLGERSARAALMGVVSNIADRFECCIAAFTLCVSEAQFVEESKAGLMNAGSRQLQSDVDLTHTHPVSYVEHYYAYTVMGRMGRIVNLLSFRRSPNKVLRRRQNAFNLLSLECMFLGGTSTSSLRKDRGYRLGNRRSAPALLGMIITEIAARGRQGGGSKGGTGGGSLPLGVINRGTRHLPDSPPWCCEKTVLFFRWAAPWGRQSYYCGGSKAAAGGVTGGGRGRHQRPQGASFRLLGAAVGAADVWGVGNVPARQGRHFVTLGTPPLS
ncbi:hypothetical protein B0H16DRAFT_1773393 [Mycena metata]|uniref:Uncharacterized protein n=1 Tax=Mycena metata TaxID=1033252 RepID=A0AAD7HYI0_9AGAR|nr:hypothetical protein B0H16DRAFT_1773393 [Mycena metata]